MGARGACAAARATATASPPGRPRTSLSTPSTGSSTIASRWSGPGWNPRRAAATRTRSSATERFCRPPVKRASRCGSASTTSRCRAGSPTTAGASSTSPAGCSPGCDTSNGWRRPSATWCTAGSRSTSPWSTPLEDSSPAICRPGRQDAGDFGAVLRTILRGQRRSGTHPARGGPAGRHRPRAQPPPTGRWQRAGGLTSTQVVDETVWRLVGRTGAARAVRPDRLLLLLRSRSRRRRLVPPVAARPEARAAGLRAVGRGSREVLHRLADEHPDRPLLISEIGIGTADEEERETYARDVARPSPKKRSRRASTCAACSGGPASTTTSGTTASTSPSACSTATATPARQPQCSATAAAAV